MLSENLKEKTLGLLRIGYEGIYWDFKKDYTDCREDKLIEIICTANNIDGYQAYLIYGVDDNGNVKGIENTTYRINYFVLYCVIRFSFPCFSY